MNLTDKFLADIKTFMRKHKMSYTLFGIKAMQDPHAVFEWLSGRRKPFMKSVDRVYTFMSSYKPED